MHSDLNIHLVKAQQAAATDAGTHTIRARASSAPVLVRSS
jgi:hypothetical protein